LQRGRLLLPLMPQAVGLPSPGDCQCRSEMSERTACTPEAVAVLPSRHMSGHRRWIVQFLFPCHQCNVTFSCVVCDVVVQTCKAGAVHLPLHVNRAGAPGAPALFQYYYAGNCGSCAIMYVTSAVPQVRCISGWQWAVCLWEPADAIAHVTHVRAGGPAQSFPFFCRLIFGVSKSWAGCGD
jgi:hypothetical protein